MLPSTPENLSSLSHSLATARYALHAPSTGMELILHHYDPSPYSEKVRLMFGLEALTWRSVIVPMVLPVIGFIAWLIAGPRGR